MRKFFIIASLLAFVTMWSSCSKDETANAPAIPPSESMVMSFEAFKNTKSEMFTNKNFATAVIHAGIWNTVIAITLAVPVTAFNESFKHQMVVKEENTWAWPYDFSLGNMLYNAELTATYDEGKYYWQMKISKVGGFQNYVWFTGEMNEDGTSGFWVLNESQIIQSPFLKITWEKDASGKINMVKYESVKTSAPSYGSSITYGITNSTDLNAYYTIENAQNNNDVFIEWNSTLHNGRIKDIQTFGDQNWHCWDTMKQDTSCD